MIFCQEDYYEVRTEIICNLLKTSGANAHNYRRNSSVIRIDNDQAGIFCLFYDRFYGIYMQLPMSYLNA